MQGSVGQAGQGLWTCPPCVAVFSLPDLWLATGLLAVAVGVAWPCDGLEAVKVKASGAVLYVPKPYVREICCYARYRNCFLLVTYYI